MAHKIYDKTVKEILTDYARINKTVFTKKDVISFFKEKYPLIKERTILAHLTRCSVNDKNRVNYSLHNDGSDDLFYKIDAKTYRNYNKHTDGTPIYKKESRTKNTGTFRKGENSHTLSEELQILD